MIARVVLVGILATSATSATALAQRKSAPAGKTDAKALLASGLKLFQAKDYLGALAVFRDAYERFPSTKILLNIGTTLKALGRNAEAANTYQRYLDASDTDPARKGDVTKVLTELDAKVGLVELAVTPPDAEVQIVGPDATWVPAAELPRLRVEPGTTTIRARKTGFEDLERVVQATAGQRTPVAFELAPVEVAVAPPPTVAVTTTVDDVDDGPEQRRSPSRLGAYAVANIDVANKGGAARVAATFELIPRLQAELGGIIGPSPGAYVGARYAILGGTFRPLVAVGAPIFFEDGARVAVRGAAGLEVVLSPHISAVVELGVERVINPGMNYVETMFVPAIGAAGRL